MNAIPSRSMASTSASGSADRLRRASALVALTLLMASIEGAAQEQIAAVWKRRELTFSYASSTAIYSCSALERRVASILRAVGARDDLQVDARNCLEFVAPPDAGMPDRANTEGPGGHPQFVHVYVRVTMPIEATPEVLAEIEKDKARRELVARVTGNPDPNEPVVFTAQWQPIILSRKTIGLEPEECELLDQMSASVLRELGVRVVRRGFTCHPNRDSRISPELEVATLRGTLFETSSAPRAPAAREEDTDPGVPADSDDEHAEPATDKPLERLL